MFQGFGLELSKKVRVSHLSELSKKVSNTSYEPLYESFLTKYNIVMM